MEDNKLIGFRLVGIHTNEFATFENTVDTGVECFINTNMNFEFSAENKVVGVNVKFVFECNDKPIIVIAVSCFFNIEHWDDYFDTTNSTLTLVKKFAQHIAVITIGTTRGILHCKTENNKNLNSFLLPSINVIEMVPEDIIIGKQ